ncbi:hypothetical protein Tco_0320895 [Tanacetum coccineum]
MNTTTQQTTLDNALVAPGDRVKIGKCNMRIIPILKMNEPSYQVVLDALAFSPLYPAFLITAEFKQNKKKCRIDVEVFRDILQIYPSHPNQEFVKPLSLDEEIVSFIKELGYKGDIKSIIKIGNRNTSVAQKENMPYLRFTKAINYHFISKGKSISMRNRHFMHTVQDDTLLGSLKFVSKTEEYQPYGALIPAEMTNLKIDTPGVFVSKKKALAKAERSKGIDLMSEAAMLEEA